MGVLATVSFRMNDPTHTKLATRGGSLIQPSKYTPFVVVTISVVAAILAVWARWTYWTPHGRLVPSENLPLVLAGFFTAAILTGFGAAIPNSGFWRRTLQGLAGVLLLAFVVLPIELWRAEWAYHLIVPSPAIQQRSIGPLPGKPREERLVTIRAKPSIEKRGISTVDKVGYEVLVLRSAQEGTVEIVCGSTFSRWYSTLPQDRQLTFTVWQTKDVMWHTYEGKEEGVSWLSDIETIQEGNQMIYDARVCPLHKLGMERVEVPVHFGLPSQEFIDAYEGFSGGPGFVSGGCVFDGKEHKEMSYRCPKCVVAYEKWVAQMRGRIKQDTKQKSS